MMCSGWLGSFYGVDMKIENQSEPWYLITNVNSPWLSLDLEQRKNVLKKSLCACVCACVCVFYCVLSIFLSMQNKHLNVYYISYVQFLYEDDITKRNPLERKQHVLLPSSTMYSQEIPLPNSRETQLYWIWSSFTQALSLLPHGNVFCCTIFLRKLTRGMHFCFFCLIFFLDIGIVHV